MIVYLIYCPQSGKGYVGQTIKTIEERWKSHISAARRSNYIGCVLFNNAIRKYKPEAFELSVLQECLTLDELNIAEVFHIKAQNTLTPNGYNIKTGGRKNGTLSAEGRAKISATHKGNKYAVGGRGPKGRHLTDEAKAHLRNINLGKKQSLEAKAKQIAAQMGRICSPETRAKIGDAHRGKVISIETREKIRNSVLKQPRIAGKFAAVIAKEG